MRSFKYTLIAFLFVLGFNSDSLAQKSSSVSSFKLSDQESVKSDQIRARLNSSQADTLILSYYDLVEGPFAWTVDQNFDESSASPPDSGFVLGPNIYGDQAKALSFVVPDSVSDWGLVEVGIYYSYLRPDITNETVEILIMNGNADTGPTGTPLYSQTFSLSDSAGDFYNHTENQNDGGITLLFFDQTVITDREFFVVYDFASSDGDPGLLGLAASSEISNRVPEAWERWSDGTWNNISDSWFNGGAGIYPWIDVAVLSNVVTSSENELPRGVSSFDAFPNPSVSGVNIRLELSEPGHLQLEIFDSLGRRVRSVLDQDVNSGRLVQNVDMQGLSGGRYYARLFWDEKQFMLPITLLR